MEEKDQLEQRTIATMSLAESPAQLCVAGTGAWGRCIGALLARLGHHVTLWSPTGRDLTPLCEAAHDFPGKLLAATTLEEAARGARAVIVAVSSPHVREVARALQALTPRLVVVLTKGLEAGTGLRLSEVIRAELPQTEVCVLSGGSHAEEVALGMPFAVAAAAKRLETAREVKAWFVGSEARIEETTDLLGVELCAVLKNVIAIGAGIADGLALGDNFRGALISRGMTELSVLLTRAGGNPATLMGPAGLGDLLATALSPHSRNRRFGLAVGRGLSMEAALQEVGAVVEGVNALEACIAMEAQLGLALRFPLVLRAILRGERAAAEIKHVID